MLKSVQPDRIPGLNSWLAKTEDFLTFFLHWNFFERNHKGRHLSMPPFFFFVFFFYPEPIGRNSQTLSCNWRQIRYKLEDLKDAPRPSHRSLSLSAWSTNFPHMHPQLPSCDGHTLVILHPSIGGKTTSSAPSLKGLKRHTVFGATGSPREFSRATEGWAGFMRRKNF